MSNLPTINVTSYAQLQLVQFTDTSVGSPTNWRWDVNDHIGVSTDRNPIIDLSVYVGELHHDENPPYLIIKLTVSSGEESVKSYNLPIQLNLPATIQQLTDIAGSSDYGYIGINGNYLYKSFDLTHWEQLYYNESPFTKVAYGSNFALINYIGLQNCFRRFVAVCESNYYISFTFDSLIPETTGYFPSSVLSLAYALYEGNTSYEWIATCFGGELLTSYEGIVWVTSFVFDTPVYGMTTTLAWCGGLNAETIIGYENEPDILKWVGDNYYGGAREDFRGLDAIWGVTQAYGPGGYAFSFNVNEIGELHLLYIPNDSSFNIEPIGMFSVRFRIKISNYDDVQIGLFYKGNLSTGEFDYGLYFSNGNIQIQTAVSNITTSATIVDDSWHDVLWTYDNGYHRLYLDSVDKTLDENQYFITNNKYYLNLVEGDSPVFTGFVENIIFKTNTPRLKHWYCGSDFSSPVESQSGAKLNVVPNHIDSIGFISYDEGIASTNVYVSTFNVQNTKIFFTSSPINKCVSLTSAPFFVNFPGPNEKANSLAVGDNGLMVRLKDNASNDRNLLLYYKAEQNSLDSSGRDFRGTWEDQSETVVIGEHYIARGAEYAFDCKADSGESAQVLSPCSSLLRFFSSSEFSARFYVKTGLAPYNNPEVYCAVTKDSGKIWGIVASSDQSLTISGTTSSYTFNNVLSAPGIWDEIFVRYGVSGSEWYTWRVYVNGVFVGSFVNAVNSGTQKTSRIYINNINGAAAYIDELFIHEYGNPSDAILGYEPAWISMVVGTRNHKSVIYDGGKYIVVGDSSDIITTVDRTVFNTRQGILI